jgi:hypothetical protein
MWVAKERKQGRWLPRRKMFFEIKWKKNNVWSVKILRWTLCLWFKYKWM